MLPRLLLFLVAALPLLSAQTPANILIVVADDIGVDGLACYAEGAAPASTPTIDALASNGILFRNAWAYPSCSPTRASLLTGRHPSRTMVGRWIRFDNNTAPPIGTLRDSEWTIPKVLDRANSGYVHAAIGKWHMHDHTFGVSPPLRIAGFQHFTGFMDGELPDYYAWPRVDNGLEQTCAAYATTQQTDDAITWMQAQTQPWFCYLAYNAVHMPFHVPPANLTTRTVTGTSSDREKYKAMVEAMDTELGRLFATLGPTVMQNTHVLLIGDNGTIPGIAEAPFDPLRSKFTPYEGGVNVPLIYAGPATVSPGREVTALTCAVDLFATVLDLAGATAVLPPGVTTDGESLVPYLGNPSQPALRAFAYSEAFVGNAWPAPLTNGYAIARDDRYKLILRSTGLHEMYDLQQDPWERTNLLLGQLSATEDVARQALEDEIDRVRTPRGHVATFGSGCTGSAGVPAIGHSSEPRFGMEFDVTLTGAAPSSPAILLTGWSEDVWGQQQLPLDLGPYGAGTGCTLWIAPDYNRLTVTDSLGAASLSYPVPNLPQLLEARLLHSWLVLDPQAPGNPLFLVGSDAMAAVLGM